MINPLKIYGDWLRSFFWVVTQPKLRPILYLTVMIIALGTGFYHWIEGLSWVDAFYFTVVTITTLGYGDIVPQGDLSKIFTVFYALTGIVLLFASAQKIGETIIDYQLQKYQERRDKNNSETG